jgi:hypothetical protein
MITFLRTEKGYYVYRFECACCGAFGELGVPVRQQSIIDHGCGQLFIQVLPTAMFQQPRLIEVNRTQTGRA